MSLIQELRDEINEVTTRKEYFISQDNQSMVDDCNWRLDGMNERLREYMSVWNEYVYVLTNPSSPHIVKIGMTTRTPEERVKEINSATGVIEEWELHWYIQCGQSMDLEKSVHEYLGEFRVRDNREGFKCTPTQAIAAIQKINEERY